MNTRLARAALRVDCASHAGCCFNAARGGRCGFEFFRVRILPSRFCRGCPLGFLRMRQFAPLLAERLADFRDA